MKSLLILFTFITSFVYSQFCPSLGPDQILPCGVGSTTLTADLSQCGPGGTNPNQTTNYNCVNIPYLNQTNTGTQLFMGDDTQQGPFNIGFTFCYFGQTYTQFWVGSNGWVSFSAGQPTTFTSAAIPNAGFNIPKNCIMGPWQDWHPGVGGQMDYIRGAALSEGGKPMIALPSQTHKGISRIVPTLKEGAGVVTTRAHVHYVVTEWGVANLFGKNIYQRIKALINISHPDHRAYLWETAEELYNIRASVF